MTGRQRSLDAAVEAHCKNHEPSDRSVGPTIITQECLPKEQP